MAAALPAWPQAPRCDAATCPPLQLRLEEGFQVSRQRLEQGPQAAAAAQRSTAPGQPIQQAQPQASATAGSPWLAAALALVAGMLLQWRVQGLLRRRRTSVAAAVVPTPAQARASVRASGLARDVPPLQQAAVTGAEPSDEPEEAPSIATQLEAPAADVVPDAAFFVVPAEAVSEAGPSAEASTVVEAEPAATEMLPEPAPLEAATAQPAPASPPEQTPAATSDADHLETVALLRRLSAQRARGLHPEERLVQVFRRIASGRTEAAARSLRELEAFCSGSEEAFPSELMTTRQHIARGRDYDLGKRIDGLRARAQDEASGRRLAVAGAFLRRGRFDAVAEVLDELESDLIGEVEVL
ncbi:hypothetical protein D0B54_04555 [Solimonas sp. K1W22B-7]|uniref:hypothetical protein n=1 Tax=Solimonas sp. K1W22B-7 TaxID=2303331 RepID=UPI000E331C5A|nr:hypothetical protein [Solimonas sp. K1W22B-7]AXQ27987.1 hypothetical protein D0B54_04555 [Solimonas sp. K1W22B-7]